MQIRGTDLAVESTGSGRPFLWGHGMTWSRALEDETGLFDWRGLDDQLRLIRYDARGHGRSAGTDLAADYQWPSLAGDMLALADALDFEHFIAGGASMGCATAIYAALAAPERVDALVLALPPTAWETRAAQAGVYIDMAQATECDGLAALVRLFGVRPLFPPFLLQALPELRAIAQRHLARMTPTCVPALLRGAGASNLPPRDIVATLDMPTLILAWSDDTAHPLSTAEALAELLPQAQLQVASTLDQVRAWPQRLREFVAELE